MSSSAGPGARRHLPRSALIGATAALVIGADQVTKSLALSQLQPGQPHHVAGPTNLVLTFNRGAAFSLGTGVAPLVEALAVALAIALLVVTRRLALRGAGAGTSIGLGLLCGGAVSNLADRFARHHHGAVVDFIQLVNWWPVFNVADASITVGAVLLAICLVLAPPTAPAGSPAPTSQPEGGSPGPA